MTSYNLKEIIINEILMPSLYRLYEEDYFNIYYHATERNICARLAHHMENIMRCCDNNMLFGSYYVDVEYNLMGAGSPKLYQYHKSNPKYMVSDLLIHGRGCLQNMLAIEMKKKGQSRKVIEDKERLESLVSSMSDNPESQYIYKTIVGAFITYSPKEILIELFEDINGHGEKTGEIEFVCNADGDRFLSLDMIRDSLNTSAL